ncbi:hypothetical protein C8T65DRAFT_587611 [Cerioporus squamosus]|nr:hypothetical protein C8T65DRAFT_587611 [Cerioporus squamosus]
MKISAIDPRVGQAVQELSIYLTPPAFATPRCRFVYCRVLRNALRSAPNVTDLTLLVPETMPPDVFFLVDMQQLRLFKTNLPHAMIAGFLGNHPFITDLVIGPCGSVDEPCPLRDIDLEHVATLECEQSCVSAIAHPGLFRLSVDNHSAHHASTIFRSLAAPPTDLYSLTLDFLPDEHNVLANIAYSSPRLRKLKLLERKGSLPSRRNSPRPRRAFNDYLAWHRGLRKLPFLEEVALRTSAALVSRAADLEMERRLILGWATGLCSRTVANPSRALNVHPQLYHITIWYGSTLANSVLSKWFKDTGVWTRIGKPLTGETLYDVDF